MSVVDHERGDQRDLDLARTLGPAHGVDLKLVEARPGRRVDHESRLFRRLLLGYEWK